MKLQINESQDTEFKQLWKDEPHDWVEFYFNEEKNIIKRIGGAKGGHWECNYGNH